ncbi:MAG: hypothetical protein GPJ54_04830 [Candidatus Heimdallarchaeota archaeon]|nr:hypothetical protein [Candidatus Heimdallarchaeota archaeon]
MKKLGNSKLIMFLAFVLATIVSVSACSLATPESVYFANIELTDNSDQILVTVSDKDYNKWELIFDVSTTALESVNNQVSIGDLEIQPSEQNYSSQLFENATGVFWILTNTQDQSEFGIKLTQNKTLSIEAVEDYMFFVSDSLKTAYLLLPYDADISGGIKDSVLYATIAIVPLEDPNNIKYSFVAHSYLTDLFSTNFKVYDGLHVFFIHGNGADCVNSIYFTYDQDSFQFLSQTSAWQDDLIDPRNNKLIISSYYYQTRISEIKMIDLDNFEETKFEVSDDEILALLDIETSKSTSSLTTMISSTINNTVSSVLPIFGIYLPLGFVVSLFIVKLKIRNKNQ